MRAIIIFCIYAISIKRKVLFKTECGGQFTSKFEGMFKDMQVSGTLMEQYRQHREGIDGAGNSIDLYVRVLTTGCWPTQAQAPVCALPRTANDAFEVVFACFLKKFLNWITYVWFNFCLHCMIE